MIHAVPSTSFPSSSGAPHTHLKHFIPGLISQFQADKSSCICRKTPQHSGANAGKETLYPAGGINLPNDLGDGDLLGGALQPALDGVDGEHEHPHGDAGGAAGETDGGEAELAVVGGEPTLQELIGGKVDGGARAVAGQRRAGATEYVRHAALTVQLADHVERGGVARRARSLPLQLELDLYALEGCRDERHRDGGEEPRQGDLRDCERGGRRGAGGAARQGFAHVVAPER
jgi:hypothetical protein